MDNFDLRNIQFLFTASEQVLREWYDQADTNDIAYVTDLLNRYNQELDVMENNVLAEQYGVNFIAPTVDFVQ